MMQWEDRGFFARISFSLTKYTPIWQNLWRNKTIPCSGHCVSRKLPFLLNTPWNLNSKLQIGKKKVFFNPSCISTIYEDNKCMNVVGTKGRVRADEGNLVWIKMKEGICGQPGISIYGMLWCFLSGNPIASVIILTCQMHSLNFSDMYMTCWG